MHHITRKINDYQCMKSQSKCRHFLTRFFRHNFFYYIPVCEQREIQRTVKLTITLCRKITVSLLPLLVTTHSISDIYIKLSFSQLCWFAGTHISWLQLSLLLEIEKIKKMFCHKCKLLSAWTRFRQHCFDDNNLTSTVKAHYTAYYSPMLINNLI